MWINGRVIMFNTVEEIKAANEAVGQLFFSPETMRFWGTRVSKRVYPTPTGTFFVTSDRDPFGGRRWSVRFARLDGKIETVTFQASSHRSGAHRDAAEMAKRNA